MCTSSAVNTWFKQGDIVPRSLIFGKNIHIKRASSEHSGVYTCRGVNKKGLPFEAEATVLVGGKVTRISILLNILCCYKKNHLKIVHLHRVY